MILKSPDGSLALDVTHRGKVVTMKVVEQDSRITSKYGKPVIRLASWRQWSLRSACRPEIVGDVALVYVRGDELQFDNHKARVLCNSETVAKFCVAAIRGLVKRVKLPKGKP